MINYDSYYGVQRVNTHTIIQNFTFREISQFLKGTEAFRTDCILYTPLNYNSASTKIAVVF